jgi:hypothetical protein
MAGFKDLIAPMDLANTGENGVGRSPCRAGPTLLFKPFITRRT